MTKAGAESANYPFCTIDPNVGIVPVPDERLKLLGDFYQSKKVTPAVIEFVDIAGLVKGASKGEGLGNQFLANIREVDAIVHVVRCFEDENVIHVDGCIDPLRDIETINLELIFSDLEILERRIAKTTKSARMDKEAAKELEFLKEIKAHLEAGEPAASMELENEDQELYMKGYNLLTWKPKEAAKELEFLKEIKAHLEAGEPAASMELENEDQELYMKGYNLLTWKPVIYAANVSEDDLADDGASNAYVQQVREYAAKTDSEVFALCAEIEQEISELEEDEKKEFLEDLGIQQSGLEKLIVASYRLLGLLSFLTSGIEQEISELEEDEKKEFLEDLGIQQSGLEKLIVASYRLLGLLSFLTSGEDETRAWTIKVGTKAPQAAGKIHTDFERGFIKAEVVNYQDLLDCGSYAGAREKGLVRMEGKEYVVQDGDVILFRFNV